MKQRTQRRQQVPMSFSRRGGARLGAGRPKSPTSGVPHLARPALSGREPVHVTMRLREHVFQLRSRRCFGVIRAALAAGCDRHGLRITSVSVQGNHLHLIAEAGSAEALSRGLQALAIRFARGLNRLMGRKGKVFADRYHSHVLRTPREVRAALAYVAANASRHAAQYGRPLAAAYRDPFVVGYFGGRVVPAPDGARLFAEPRTWLLCTGWRRGAAQAGRGETRRPARDGPPREAGARERTRCVSPFGPAAGQTRRQHAARERRGCRHRARDRLRSVGGLGSEEPGAYKIPVGTSCQ